MNTVLSDLYVSDMKHDYKFRLSLAVVKAIPDTYNFLYNEYNAFGSPVWPKFFESDYVYTLAKATHLYVRSHTKQVNRQTNNNNNNNNNKLI